MLVDTHCHIHWPDYPINPDVAIENARRAGVEKMICVGTNVYDSRLAIEFAAQHDNVYSTVGIHPHYAKDSDVSSLGRLLSGSSKENGSETQARDSKIVAIGEIGLDYHYNQSPREDQIKLLEQQIDLALKYNLPVVFHVREAYDDFWPVLDNFSNVRGVLHSFTDTWQHAQEGMKRGFYFGINGISTFTKDSAQSEMFAKLPIDRIMFETDAPLLTPAPLRGKVKANEPAYIAEIAKYNAELRGIDLSEVSAKSTENASSLFNLL